MTFSLLCLTLCSQTYTLVDILQYLVKDFDTFCRSSFWPRHESIITVNEDVCNKPIRVEVSASYSRRVLEKKNCENDRAMFSGEQRKSILHATVIFLTFLREAFYYHYLLKPCKFNVNLRTFVLCVRLKVPKSFKVQIVHIHQSINQSIIESAYVKGLLIDTEAQKK